jgi:hypothetical protein
MKFVEVMIEHYECRAFWRFPKSAFRGVNRIHEQTRACRDSQKFSNRPYPRDGFPCGVETPVGEVQVVGLDWCAREKGARLEREQISPVGRGALCTK